MIDIIKLTIYTIWDMRSFIFETIGMGVVFVSLAIAIFAAVMRLLDKWGILK